MTPRAPLVTSLLDSGNPDHFDVPLTAAGPEGKLPLSADRLRKWPSGHLFGLSQNAGMGWDPQRVADDPYLILSTQGGVRRDDGRPVALGFHTGHWEVGVLVEAAAEALRALGGLPFAGACSDPCDGRTQGTAGMFDSLPYRNDAASVLGRLIRSLPLRRGVLGIATCDKGLPAMLMALARARDLPGVLVPGGVTLPPTDGEDAGKIQTIGTRFAHGELSLEQAAELGCRACASPGGGCQFLGTAATSQVVAEALGLCLPHSALAPSGEPIWKDAARRSAAALVQLATLGICSKDILTPAALHNAMVTYCAFGGSTNLLIHLAAVAHEAGLPVPTVSEWQAVHGVVPRLVDALPNGPHPTVRVFLAGGVPEVMLHLRDMGLLDLNALTVTGHSLGESLSWWEASARRAALKQRLADAGVSPTDVICDPQQAQVRGFRATNCFPTGNLCPQGAVIKSAAVSASLFDAQGVLERTGTARVFHTEQAAVAAIKGTDNPVLPGTVLILAGRGPLGAGMEEVYQVTSALSSRPWGKEVTVLTDARFSGASAGPCIGHASPEALLGGALGKVRDGDRVRVLVDTRTRGGRIDLVGDASGDHGVEWGNAELTRRTPHPELCADPNLPAATRLWAALQHVSGGPWSGCVFDTDRIVERLMIDGAP